MCRLIETIKLIDGDFKNLRYHEQRMRKSLRHLFGYHGHIGLEEYLRNQYFPSTGLHRCRVVYDVQSREVAYWPYSRRQVETLRIVDGNEIDYSFKFEDRSAINQLVEQRGDCDDVLIVRDGYVTDCSYANIAFRRGEDWFTPDPPLLGGTMRQKLIDDRKITPIAIRAQDIQTFDTFRLVNAMLEFGSPEIDVSGIVS